MIREVFQYFDRLPIPANYHDLMEKVKFVTERNFARYSLIIGDTDYLKVTGKPFSDSIFVRLKELSKRDNALWVDADCEISDVLFKYDYIENMPYVLKMGCPAAVMFNNGKKEIFEKMYNLYSGTRRCICQEYIIHNPKKFEFLPIESARHFKFRQVGKNE